MQSDVYQAFLDQAASGNAEAGRMIRPLRVIMPLYNEEIYFIARADSPLQLRARDQGREDQRRAAAAAGRRCRATTIYRLMFGAADARRERVSYLTNEEALVKLAGDKSIDVVVIVAGQPAKLLADMKPEARS